MIRVCCNSGRLRWRTGTISFLLSLACCQVSLGQYLQPTRRTSDARAEIGRAATVASLPAKLFDSGVLNQPMLGEVLLGDQAKSRRSMDVGSLLQEPGMTSGVVAQQRSPVSRDIRIRGSRTGQIIGAGSLWHPGREDLDTALNKIFSSNLSRVVITKGPYSVRHGPSFNVVEMQLEQAPIQAGGTPIAGLLSLDYDTNGQQFVGRQQVRGGDDRWGFLASYGHGTAVDFEAGNGRSVPSSFKSRDLYTSLGYKVSEERRIDFGYIRLDQTDVEYPGLVYDVNFLVTDGFEAEYVDTSYDRFQIRAEAWYNRTRFEGDSQKPAKIKQIPQLATEFSSLGLATDVDGSSLGYRLMATTEAVGLEWTVGTDLSYLDQTLNDREVLGPNAGNNYPIPHSNAVDVGVFFDATKVVSPQVVSTWGARADHATYSAARIVPGTPGPIDRLKQAGLDQSFDMWAMYLSTDYSASENLTWTLNVGSAQRAPTFTELYATQSFIGTLQRGLTFLDGDPTLRPERLKQIDLALTWQADDFRFRLGGFHSWIHDYITYDLVIPTVRRGGLSTGVAPVNTDLATLAGFELETEFAATSNAQVFGRVSFVEGRDHSRSKPSRLGGQYRSGERKKEEPLPGIPPMDSVLGVRLVDPSPDRLWNIEMLGRFVATQDRVATSLQELQTRNFFTADVRSFWQLTNQLGFYAGVENVFDELYREHLDYRVGKGILRRGRNFYLGTDFKF